VVHIVWHTSMIILFCSEALLHLHRIHKNKRIVESGTPHWPLFIPNADDQCMLVVEVTAPCAHRPPLDEYNIYYDTQLLSVNTQSTDTQSIRLFHGAFWGKKK